MNREYKVQIRFIPLDEPKSFDVPFKPFNEKTAKKVTKDGKKFLRITTSKWSVFIDENGEVISAQKINN